MHPHYRAELPLEATLPKVQAGFDEFVTEKYHDQIAAILAEWTAASAGSYLSGFLIGVDANVLSPR